MDTKIHDIQAVKAERDGLFLVVDGQSYHIPWANCSTSLIQANETERGYIEISPSGYGLHWPLLDEDLAITPLIRASVPVQTEAA
ncbi:MAG: DUF2442 domain-containing protein [Anaerolinea sp.]|nr:DUF2442 domain-containing protein [Anaerolinea sp.]